MKQESKHSWEFVVALDTDNNRFHPEMRRRKPDSRHGKSVYGRPVISIFRGKTGVWRVNAVF